MRGILAVTTEAVKAVEGVDLGQLVQFGVLGVMFVFIILRKYIVPEWTLTHQKDQYEARLADKDKQLEDAIQEAERLRTLLEALHGRVQDEIVPALVRFNDVAVEFVRRGGAGDDPERAGRAGEADARSSGRGRGPRD